MKFKPIGDRVVVQPVKVNDRTESGLYIPEMAQEKPVRGKVLAVGPGARNQNGDTVPMSIKPGDMVLYDRRLRYMETEIEGTKVLIMREGEVIGTEG